MTNFFNFIYSPLRLRAFRWWLLACGSGALLHRLLVTFALNVIAPTSPISDVISYRLVTDVLFFVLPYVMVGGFQWLIIRQYFTRPQGWLSVIALQGGIHWLLQISFISYYLNIYPVVLGLGFGLAGWLFFRDRVPHATYWIAAAVITQVALHLIYTGFATTDLFFAVLSDPQNIQSSTLLVLLQDLLRFVMQGCFTGWVLGHFIITQKQADLHYL